MSPLQENGKEYSKSHLSQPIYLYSIAGVMKTDSGSSFLSSWQAYLCTKQSSQ